MDAKKRCGAKAKQRKGIPCQRWPSVGGNGRCKLHNGLKKSIHGRWSYKAIKERTLERNFLYSMVEVTKQLIEELKNGKEGISKKSLIQSR